MAVVEHEPAPETTAGVSPLPEAHAIGSQAPAADAGRPGGVVGPMANGAGATVRLAVAVTG